MPNTTLVKRLNDNAAGWSGGSNTRFSSNNECDFLLFDTVHRNLLALELKSTKEKSLTFWREDFEDKNKKQSFMIRKCQIQGLEKWSHFDNVTCGFVINFRSLENQTYFVKIQDFLKYTKDINKKSVSIDDILKMNPIKVDNSLLRTNYKYDIESFLGEVNR